MVYYTSSKSEAERSVPVFIYLGMAHPWSVVWPVRCSKCTSRVRSGEIGTKGKTVFSHRELHRVD